MWLFDRDVYCVYAVCTPRRAFVVIMVWCAAVWDIKAVLGFNDLQDGEDLFFFPLVSFFAVPLYFKARLLYGTALIYTQTENLLCRDRIGVLPEQ